MPRNCTQIWRGSDFSLLPLNPIPHHHFLAAGHFCPTCKFRVVANRWFKPRFHLIITDPSWKDPWVRSTSLMFVKSICSYSTTNRSWKARTPFFSMLNSPCKVNRDRKCSVCWAQFRGLRLCVPILNLLFSVQAHDPQQLDRKQCNPGKMTENKKCPWPDFGSFFPVVVKRWVEMCLALYFY